MNSIPAVLQLHDNQCGFCITAWIARSINIPADVRQIETWMNKRRKDLTQWDVPGMFEVEPALWLHDHGADVGLLRVPRSPYLRLQDEYGLDALFSIVSALAGPGMGLALWYTCAGIKDPKSLHFRAIAMGKIMCPRLGILPLSRENFFRLPQPGPIPQSWNLWWVQDRL